MPVESGLSPIAGGSLLCGWDHRDALTLRLQEGLAFLALPHLSGHKASHQLFLGYGVAVGPQQPSLPL